VQTKGGASDIFMVLFAFGFILGCWHISIPKHTHPQRSSALGIFKMRCEGERQNYITKFLVALQNKLSGNLHDVYVAQIYWVELRDFCCKTPGTCYLVITKRSKLSLFREWFFSSMLRPI
jgi:hypothetical protein